MISAPLRYAKGDTLRIQEPDRSVALWTVMERSGRGWKLSPLQEGDTRTLNDNEIRARRRWIEHYRCNPLGLSEDHAELLKRAFSSHPKDRQRIADRRVVYLREVDGLRASTRMTLDDCFLRVPSVVFAREGAEWRREDQEAIREAANERAKRQRIPPELRKNPPKAKPEVKPPEPSTLKAWYQLWMTAGQDIRVMIPLHGKRGNKTRRKKGADATVYERMDWYIRNLYFKDIQSGLKSTWRVLDKELSDKGLYVSYQTYRLFLNKNFDDHEVTKARGGWRKAHQEHDVFQRRRSPDKPLDEIEIDHCLLDMIVIHEKSGRPLGRPWLTLAIDRRTRCILGVHVSFEVPSFASLQRCLAHAFWPKDLSGLGLRHDWPCEGVPRLVFVDNGREFLSRSLGECERSLGFTVANLAPRQPWLKGRVERVFGRINVQVFDLEQGKTFSSAAKRGEYNSVKRARMTLTELRQKLLAYIVDDYHVSYHEGLKGVPLEEWIRLTDREHVDGVRSYDEIRRLLGAIFLRPITKVGVRLFGLVYYSPRLTDLRRRRGGNQRRFTVRCDPFDLGYVEILDEETGDWIEVHADEPERARGVSIHQARANERRARRIATGHRVTGDDLQEGVRQMREETAAELEDGDAVTTAARAARYGLDNGQFFTPLVGQQEAGETTAKSNDNDGPAIVAAGGVDGSLDTQSEAVDAAATEGSGDDDGDDDVSAQMAAALLRWSARA